MQEIEQLETGMYLESSIRQIRIRCLPRITVSQIISKNTKISAWREGMERKRPAEN